MRLLGPHHHLSRTLLHCLHQSAGLTRSVLRRVRQPLLYLRAAAGLRVVPRALQANEHVGCSRDIDECRTRALPCDDRERGWPFDTPMPSGLPRLDEAPGQPAHDRAAGTSSVVGAAADNGRLPALPPVSKSSAGGSADVRGTLIDVWA